MEKDIQKYVSTCELCQLAKGTKPFRQGFLSGWKHSKVLHTVCMDLIGPIGGEVSSGKAPHAPRHILVITDPYSHMVWLENLYTKSAVELFMKCSCLVSIWKMVSLESFWLITGGSLT